MQAALSTPPQSALRYVIRPGTAEDEGFLARGWADTFRGSDSSVRRIEPIYFNRHVYPRIGVLLKRCEVRIASPTADDSTIYGFAVLEPRVVHMVYTRKPFRRMGIARALLDGVDIRKCVWTTLSQDLRTWIRPKYRLGEYRPFWMEGMGAYRG